LWRTPSHVFAVSYETLRQDVVADPDNLRQPEEIEWDVVILDEAQKIKNQRTTAAQVCKRLKRRASWALTGTPLENDLNDLLSIIDFLTPLPGGVYDDVFERQASLQLRRRKADVLQDLPPKSVFDLWLQLHPQQRRTYERVEQEGVVDLRQRGRSVTITHVLALIQRLKQVCNVCPETGASAKLEDLADRLGEIAAEGQRALVFSQYVDSEYGVGGIVQRLDDLNPLAYHGGLSAREKDAVIAMFKGSDEHKALVLSLRAGGQGLNLQEASYVVHFDRWWNPAVERQAEDRAHRLGQDSAVTVYRYICEGTIEERIDRILREKQQLFDQYVDQVSIDPGKLLGEKEIFGLFGLEPPPRAARPAIEELPA
jgi:SNF2 family DNA or RNA helicase